MAVSIHGFTIYIALSKGMGFAQSEQAERAVGNFAQFAGALSLYVGSALVALWSMRSSVCKANFVKRVKWKDVGIGIAAAGLSMALVALTASHIELDRRHPMGYHAIGEYSPTYFNHLALIFFCDTIVLPCIETIVFSCFLYTIARQKWHIVTSVMIVSALFAAVHQDFAGSLRLFSFGVINCLLMEWRETPFSSIIHHISYNTAVYGIALIL